MRRRHLAPRIALRELDRIRAHRAHGAPVLDRDPALAQRRVHRRAARGRLVAEQLRPAVEQGDAQPLLAPQHAGPPCLQ